MQKITRNFLVLMLAVVFGAQVASAGSTQGAVYKPNSAIPTPWIND